jgi:hypothetical protein
MNIQIIHLIDAIVILLSIVGEVASLLVIQDALRNLRAARQLRRVSEPVSIVTDITLSNAAVGVIGHALFAFLGVLGLTASNPRHTWLVFISAVVFVVIQCLMVGASVRVHLKRRKLHAIS